MAPANMSRRSPWLVALCIAVAVWLSDRWVWTLPALFGVVLGVGLSRAQHRLRQEGLMVSSVDFGFLLILVSFLYLYVTALLIQLCNAYELVALDADVERGGTHLIVGFVFLAVVFIGMVISCCTRVKVPGWLAQLWDRLIEER